MEERDTRRDCKEQLSSGPNLQKDHAMDLLGPAVGDLLCFGRGVAGDNERLLVLAGWADTTAYGLDFNVAYTDTSIEPAGCGNTNYCAGRFFVSVTKVF